MLTRLRSESGFTLAELSVAMAAGIIVLIGLLSIMVVVMHQAQRTFTTVDATRRARTVMATLEDDLHSACTAGAPVSGGDPPILTGSDSTDLIFLDYFGNSADPTPVWHQVTFNPSAGTLTDTSYSVGGAGPGWTQGAQVGPTVTLLRDVAARPGIPVFEYFGYSAQGTDAAGNTYYAVPDGTTVNPLTGAALAAAPLGVPLSGAGADATVEVQISLLVGASSSTLNNQSLTAASDPVSDTISLRLTTPPDSLAPGGAPTVYGPCE